MKSILISLVILVIVCIAFYFFSQDNKQANQKLAEFDTQEPKEKLSELKIETVEEGNGPEIQNGDKATVHYTGTLTDGTKFDSSLDRETPFTFTLGAGQVIQGWEKGILGMKKGEKRIIYIPSDLGYGKSGAGNVIPPDADLVFEVELLEIN